MLSFSRSPKTLSLTLKAPPRTKLRYLLLGLSVAIAFHLALFFLFSFEHLLLPAYSVPLAPFSIEIEPPLPPQHLFSPQVLKQEELSPKLPLFPADLIFPRFTRSFSYPEPEFTQFEDISYLHFKLDEEAP